MHRFSWKLAVVGLVVLAGCHNEFQLKKFTTNEALYQASLRQFNRGKWTDAVAGFEKLTLELAPRDTLAPKSFWYLGKARQHQHDYQLAANSFNRIFESFPDDSLAEYALFEEARSYQSLWTRPDRDASFGDAALATYSSLATYYPNSKLKDAAAKEVATLQAMFAEKNYGTGMYYFRDKAYDSAILYFKDILETWPDAPMAREAGLRLVEAYRAIQYKEEANETCASLRAKYATDDEVKKSCPPPPPTPPSVKPPTAGERPATR
jgi:outer membrane protein assembly factor BamD